MLNQMQFEGLESPQDAPGAPKTAAPAPDRPTGAFRRLQANRDRITFKGNPRKPDPDVQDTADVERYGLTPATTEQAYSAMPLVPASGNWTSPDSTRQFSKFGERKFVNLVGPAAVRVGQREVNPSRVEQIRGDRSLGLDPRFPAGHASQMPNVVEVSGGRRQGGTVGVAVQGTHRLAADIADGKLFTEAMVIPRSRSLDARYDRQGREANPTTRKVMERKTTLRFARYDKGDATLKEP